MKKLELKFSGAVTLRRDPDGPDVTPLTLEECRGCVIVVAQGRADAEEVVTGAGVRKVAPSAGMAVVEAVAGAAAVEGGGAMDAEVEQEFDDFAMGLDEIEEDPQALADMYK
jgi:hypothetical protein